MQYAVKFKEVGIWVNQIHNIPVCSQEGWKPFQHVPSNVIDLQYFFKNTCILLQMWHHSSLCIFWMSW